MIPFCINTLATLLPTEAIPWLPIWKNRLIPVTRLYQFSPFFQLMDDGFLAIDMFSCVHRLDGNRLMPVIGRGDDHRIHLLHRQYLTVILRKEKVIAPLTLCLFQAPVVEVTDANQPHALHR